MAQEKEKREVTKTGGVIIKDPQLVDIKTKKGEVMPALNFTIASNGENDKSVYTQCSVYGEDAKRLNETLQKGDFIHIAGHLKITHGDKTDFRNLTALSVKRISSREERLAAQKEKRSIKDQISKNKEKVASQEASKSTKDLTKEEAR